MVGGNASGRPSAAGVLAPWQRRLYRILLIPLGLIAANSIYLAAFTRDTAFFYAMLLLHLTLGLLIAIPFFVFAATHAKRMIRMWNKRAKYAGLAIFTARDRLRLDRPVHDLPGGDAQPPRRLAAARLVGPAGAGRVHPPPARAHPPAAVPPALRLGRRRRRLPRRDGGRSRSSRSRPGGSSTSTATRSSTRPPPRRSTRACSTGRSSPPTPTARSAIPTRSTSGSARRIASPRSTTPSTERASS